MRLKESLALINSFITEELSPGKGVGKSARKKLEKERCIVFPPEVKEFFDNIIQNNQFI